MERLSHLVPSEARGSSSELETALLKPPALFSGARIAIVSPASAANPDRVHAGLAHLRALGYEPILSAHALGSGPIYYSGNIAERLADLHAAFADPSIDAICCTRGGWGTAELLPHLDLDHIRSNPKPFLGYSDHTSLHTWITQQTGLVTFYAPMVSPDFAREDGVDSSSFTSALTATAPWQLGPADGLRLLRLALDLNRRTGAVAETSRTEPGASRLEGRLWGGCLSILAESLGTPFAPLPKGGILFLEDVTTKPYQWDRMLLHLRYAGLLEGVQAIIFGDMRQCVDAQDDVLLEGALLHALRDFTGPVCIGLRSGHVNTPNITLPLGVQVALELADPAHPVLHFLEAAVTPQSTRPTH